MLIFSKTPPTDFGAYKVNDPWNTVSKFLALNLDRYGFIKLQDEVKELLIANQVVKMTDFELPFAVAGNRTENFEFHIAKIEKISSNPFDKKVWIESSLLKDFLPHSKNMNGVEIEVKDRYRNTINNLTGNDISMLLGLFGKFYSKSISKSESKTIGSVQELLKGCESTDNLSYQDTLAILDILHKNEDSSSPPINLINKLKESILSTI